MAADELENVGTVKSQNVPPGFHTGNFGHGAVNLI